MRESSLLRVKWYNIIFPIAALLIVAVDQLSKVWIRASLELGQSIPAEGFFRLTRVHNTGSAFGLFSGQSELLTAASIAAICILLTYAIFLCRKLPMLNHTIVRLSTGLIFGGTVGNFIDRVFVGYVTDFIHVGTFPVFNVADSAITTGVIMFAIFLIVQARIMDAEDEEAV